MRWNTVVNPCSAILGKILNGNSIPKISKTQCPAQMGSGWGEAVGKNSSRTIESRFPQPNFWGSKFVGTFYVSFTTGGMK